MKVRLLLEAQDGLEKELVAMRQAKREVSKSLAELEKFVVEIAAQAHARTGEAHVSKIDQLPNGTYVWSVEKAQR